MARAFRNLVSLETENFNRLCEKWEKINVHEEKLQEDIRGEIRCTIGQARLLIAERFKQFSSLIDNNEFNYGDKPTTLEDLQGFWDLIYIQIEDVQNKFKHLDNLKNTNWIPVKVLNTTKVTTKKDKVPALRVNSRHNNEQALAARKRLAEAKALAARTRKVDSGDKENLKQFNAPSFFSISSPIKEVLKNSECNTRTPKLDRSFATRLTPTCEKVLLGLPKVNQNSRGALGEIN